MHKIEFKVEEGGVNLLSFLKKRIRSAPSIKAIKRALDERACVVNGQIERFASRQLKKGDAVEFRVSWKEKEAQKPLKIYEDEHILVIDKPIGFICDDKLVRQVLSEYRGKIWLAHRLDKETSGVLLLAKSSQVKEQLMSLFAERKVEKTYLALVHGAMLKESGVIDSFLTVKGRFSGQTIYTSVPQGSGVRAVTEWKVIGKGKGKGVSLVECKPLTGRTHQIRVHMSSIGHPVVGDLQYGRRRNEQGIQRCLLHAHRLRLTHPVTGSEVIFEAPIPKLDFAT